MNLDGYQLVFEDDFDGDALDLTKWEYRTTGPRRCGYNDPSQVRVENGCLRIGYAHRDGAYGNGWYAGAVSLKKRYLRGYFEIRAKCNDPFVNGFWSSFWLQAEHSYEAAIAKGGPGGAEIDVLEAMGTLDGYPGIQSTIHVTGMQHPPENAGEDGRVTHTQNPGAISRAIPDCFSVYHTYGLEWDERCYRFYADDVCYWETSWGDGVSEVPQEVILSMEIPDKSYGEDSGSGEFAVDYVRIYQKNSD